MVKIRIQLHYPAMELPKKAYPSDAGIDLQAMRVEQKAADLFLFDTGVSVEISPGYYIEIVPRSSISKTNFLLANSVGIIDPEYRGKIFVSLRYLGKNDAQVEAKKLLKRRIVQMIVRKLEPCKIEIVDSLSTTKRGDSGFGSTGA